jgi:hypothetical protein
LVNKVLRRAALATGIAIGVLFAHRAAAQPASIPRVASAPHTPSRSYDLVRKYLSDPMGADMKIVSENSQTHTIVARRADINTQTWGEWAYCKLGPSHLLDTLANGSVTVTVNIEPAANDSSFVKVKADFEGTYRLGSSETTNKCVSNGVLEDDILRAAGASPQNS